MKNPNAQNMAALRWKGKTPAQRKAHMEMMNGVKRTNAFNLVITELQNKGESLTAKNVRDFYEINQ